MKLRTALNTINETRILISGMYESKYRGIYIIKDYLAPEEEFSKAFAATNRLLKENPTVQWIDYNKAEKAIQITIK